MDLLCKLADIHEVLDFFISILEKKLAFDIYSETVLTGFT